jgi:hypothetical protein
VSLDPLPAVPAPAPAAHPVRDALLVGAFFVTLAAFAWFDPLHGRQVHTENRALAPWPTVELRADWFARFDAAFSDRFAARNALIALEHAISVRGFHSSPVGNVVLGRDQWLYFAGEDGHALDRHFRGTMPFGDDMVMQLRDELERRRQYLAARGIAYVVSVAPDKATIYPEHLPTWVTHMRAPTPLERTAELLKRDPALHFVDLREPLLEAKRSRQVYYRTDSHWNYLGAIVAYEAIMSEVQRVVGVDRLPRIAPPDIPPYVEGVDRYRGDLARLLGTWTGYEEPDFAPFAKVLGDPSRRCARRIDHDDDPGFEIYVCDRAPALRAVVYRDSMAIPLIPLLSENFRRVVYVSSRRLDRSLIEREHPDVVIDEFVERNLHVTAAFPMSP